MTPLLAEQYLDSFIDHEIHLGRVKASSFKLGRVEQLLKELGSPGKNLKVIHVAGSKGKGSIAAVIASILRAAGYSVGLYTSPHLNNYRERIRVLEPKLTPGVSLGGGGDIFPDCIGEDELGAVVNEIKPAVERVRVREGLGLLSFFEVYTALALYYFDQRGVDVVVLETGLGGRLDATNAVASLVAVIAPVSLEHTAILGDTIGKIAAEKAGIIKARGQKVVIAPQEYETREVLDGRCRQFGIDPVRVDGTVRFNAVTQGIEGQTFDLTTARRVHEALRLPLVGKHQRQNAAAAICAVEELEDLGWTIPPGAVGQGCAGVFWPGRMEVAARSPLVVLDSAHNAASAVVLSETVREVLDGKEIVLVVGVSADKDKKAICDALAGIARKVIFAKADHPRADDIEGAVDVKTALEAARAAAGREGAVLVTGSIFVVCEARKLLTGDVCFRDVCKSTRP